MPPHPTEEEVADPVKPSIPVVVFAALKLLLIDVAVLEAGMSQDAIVSEKAEEEMANPVVTASRNFFIKRELLFIFI